MLDPLTALGVVGNCLQVIDFGFRLIREGNEICNSASGALQYNEDAEDQANRLNELTQKLTESQDIWLASHGNVALDPNEARLRYLCERCGEIAVELKVQLRKLKVQGGTKKRKFNSYKQALLSVWRKDDIDAVAFRLEKYQREIDTHILVGLRQSTEIAKLENTERFNSLDWQTQDLTRTVLGGDKKLSSKLDDQQDILIQIQNHTAQIVDSLSHQLRQQELQNTQVRTEPLKLPLHEAAAAGDALQIRKILRDSNVKINARDDQGCTPLHLANNAEAARKLLAHPDMIKDIEDSGGRTALHCAVLKRRLDVVKKLLEAGIDKDVVDDTGKSAAFYARDCPAASWMLQHGPNARESAPSGLWLSNTGLIHMAFLDDVEGIKFFLSHGAEVNARNEFGETALVRTACSGRRDLAKLLIDAGADLELPTKRGATPLFQAIRFKRLKFVELMLALGANKEARYMPEWEKGSTVTPLLDACTRGHFEIAMLLAESGANVHHTNGMGQTPLMLAVKRGGLLTVKSILRKGASVEVKDKMGASPLSLCFGTASTSLSNRFAILNSLLQHGVQINNVFSDGYTALGTAARLGYSAWVELLAPLVNDIDACGQYGSGFTALAEACHHGHLEVAEILLKLGARHDIGSKIGFSALSIAASQGHWEVVQLLVTYHADIEQRPPAEFSKHVEFSFTPLIRAATNGQTATVQLLSRIGANLDAHDRVNRTALHYATLKRHYDCVDVLLDAGANSNWQDYQGTTALMMAVDNGDIEIVRRLKQGGADLQLRNIYGRTARHVAMQDEDNEAMLRVLECEQETTRQESLIRLQTEKEPSEIAAAMHEFYA